MGRAPAVGNAAAQCRRSLGGEQAEDQRGDGKVHDGRFGNKISRSKEIERRGD